MLALVMLHASICFAEPSPADKARATQLFDDAQKLMGSRDYAAACQKFRGSQRLDPQLGTLLHLADCFEKDGKTASAWAAFKDAAEIAAKRGDTRASLARDRATALEAHLSRLTVTVADATPDLEVRLDGEVLDRALWGSAAPIDPGSHEVAATAPGKRAWKKAITVAATGAALTLAVPSLESEPTAPPAAVPSKPAATPSPPVPSPALAPRGPEAGGSSVQRTTALIVGGAGIVGVGVGSVFGLMSKSRHDQAASHCSGSVCYDQDGVDLSNSARSAGNVSTIAFIVGGAGLAAGAVLWFTAPSGENKVEVGLAPGVVTARGTW